MAWLEQINPAEYQVKFQCDCAFDVAGIATPELLAHTTVATASFRGGQHVRISKVKMKFAKAAENNFSTELFRIVKVIHRRPRVVYELEDLNGTPIDGQFYSEELTPVRIISRTTYNINKILDTRVRRGISEVLVSWHGYGTEFDSLIPVASVKKIWHEVMDQQFLRNALQQRVTRDLREQHSRWFHREAVPTYWPRNLPQLRSVRLWSIMYLTATCIPKYSRCHALRGSCHDIL